MTYFSPTDLIINPDGSSYHLNLRPDQIPTTIILVGDPERVPKVSQFFDRIDEKIHKREFVTHIGMLAGQQIAVLSSGIGADNVEIVMTELDALVNIDFSTRMTKPVHRELNLIRIGTSGSIQADIPIDTFLVSEAAIGFDNLGAFYSFDSDQHLNATKLNAWAEKLSYPNAVYGAKASESLLKLFPWKKGYTVTAPGFYAPQGRTIRMDGKLPNFLNDLNATPFDGHFLTNMEMETAAYYAFAAALGHKMVSLNAILANRITHEFSANPEDQIMQLIEATLTIISSHNRP